MQVVLFRMIVRWGALGVSLARARRGPSLEDPFEAVIEEE